MNTLRKKDVNLIGDFNNRILCVNYIYFLSEWKVRNVIYSPCTFLALNLNLIYHCGVGGGLCKTRPLFQKKAFLFSRHLPRIWRMCWAIWAFALVPIRDTSCDLIWSGSAPCSSDTFSSTTLVIAFSHSLSSLSLSLCLLLEAFVRSVRVEKREGERYESETKWSVRGLYRLRKLRCTCEKKTCLHQIFGKQKQSVRKTVKAW